MPRSLFLVWLEHDSSDGKPHDHEDSDCSDRLLEGRRPAGDQCPASAAQPARRCRHPRRSGADDGHVRRTADSGSGGGADLRRRAGRWAGRAAGLYDQAGWRDARRRIDPGLTGRVAPGARRRRPRLPGDDRPRGGQHPDVPDRHPPRRCRDRTKPRAAARVAVSPAPPGRRLHPGGCCRISVVAADDGRPGADGWRRRDRGGRPADRVWRLQH